MLSVFDISINTNFINVNFTNNVFDNIENHYKDNSKNLKHTYLNFEKLQPYIDFEKYEKNPQESCLNSIKINSSFIHFNTYVLDIKKNKFDTLEKYVYDIAKFHFERLKLELNDNYAIEFWLVDGFGKNQQFHVDYQEVEKLIFNKKVTPILTTVTYFNDCDYPTILTNLDSSNNLENEKETVYISFPKMGKHIAFDGGKFFHSACNILDKNLIKNKYKKKTVRCTLNIQIWNVKLDCRPYYAPLIGDDTNRIFFNKSDQLLVLNTQDASKKNKNYHLNNNVLSIMFKNIKERTVKHNTFYDIGDLVKKNYPQFDTFFIYNNK